MKNFYKIISQEIQDSKATFQIELNPDHAIYDGHFPNFPIVPGVLLIDISQELLRLVIQKKISLSSSESIKFLKMIDPSKTPILKVEFTIDQSNIDLRVKIEIEIDEKICFRMKGLYRIN